MSQEIVFNLNKSDILDQRNSSKLGLEKNQNLQKIFIRHFNLVQDQSNCCEYKYAVLLTYLRVIKQGMKEFRHEFYTIIFQQNISASQNRI
ncbi:unnamed protein product [Paramecium octaurelia]|uniref:Uncharacterized protein n=1 Tax=Paramecium octaurelia TaxID=43137 RepID=A0A8S1VQ42_PAROT|nr:unnamed protein product [Paramecium octaurelia]